MITRKNPDKEKLDPTVVPLVFVYQPRRESERLETEVWVD